MAREFIPMLMEIGGKVNGKKVRWMARENLLGRVELGMATAMKDNS